MSSTQLLFFLRRALVNVQREIEQKDPAKDQMNLRYLLFLNELIKEQLPNESTRSSTSSTR